MLRISIASDHRGVHIKNRLVQTLTSSGFTVFDEGTHSDHAVDYPDFAQLVARKVSRGEADRSMWPAGRHAAHGSGQNRIRYSSRKLHPSRPSQLL